MGTVPRTTEARARRSGISVSTGAGGGTRTTLAKVRRNVGSTAHRGVTLGSVLRLVEGKVSHLQTVGHFCGWKCLL